MSSEENDKPELNDAQKDAVAITDGPALVVAGAGTGKTRVIVERIQRLIADGVPPNALLALTFTEKAAGEMRDRLNSSDQGVFEVTASTFNGFGNDLLQAYGGEWGLGALRLLGGTGQLVFLREHLDEFELDYFGPIANPDGQLETLAEYVSLLKQQVVLPDEYDNYIATLPAQDEAEQLEQRKHRELAQFYRRYLDLCRAQQVIDYDDQLYLTIQLLRARPNILQRLHERFRYILVDEFQDTNPMQSTFVDLLAGTSKNIMVVGDDDQSIYGWRGATLANILDFKQRYPATIDIPLTENFRSTQAILDSAYRLIQHNNPHRLEVINKLDKRLVAKAGKGQSPALKHFSSYEAELAWVAEDIKRRLDKGENPGSIAVLARRNKQGVQKVHEALELYRIPHAVAGLSNDMYAVSAVRHVIEILKAIADPLDSVALFNVLGGPLFHIAMSPLAELSTQARHEHTELADSIRQSDNQAAKDALDALDIWRSKSAEQSVGTMAYNAITESGWKQHLYELAEHDTTTFVEVQALSKFFITLKEFERIAGVPSVQNYVLNLPALQASGSSFEDPTLDISDTLVNVLSIHRAKGLEWQTVYVIDCTEGSFPMRNFGGGLTIPDALRANQTEADERIAEERRLMYVAITRAKRELTLSYSDRHGSGAARKPSRFLSEAFGNELQDKILEESSQTSLELFSPRSTTQAVTLPDNMDDNGRLVLSVSQIVTWLRCPQDFYYRYVLAMPLPPAPRLGYGTLVHGVIEKIHEGRAAGSPPTLDSLMEHVVSGLPTAGYQTRRTRERAHAQAVKTVERVYERFMHDDLPVETEWPFTLRLADIPLDIRGKIDAVYPLEDGVEIRDFKTGTTVTTDEQAKSRTQASQQLTLYALAWQQLRGELPRQLGLDFVETGKYMPVRRQQKSLDTLCSKLGELVEQLRAGEYPPGRNHVYCMHPH